jgi:hypothetical protein
LILNLAAATPFFPLPFFLLGFDEDYASFFSSSSAKGSSHLSSLAGIAVYIYCSGIASTMICFSFS